MFTIYQAEGACATFAGLCFQAGDWATWAASLATFAAVLVALGVSLWEGHRRRDEAKRFQEIAIRVFSADIGNLRGVVHWLNEEMADVTGLEPGDSMRSKVWATCAAVQPRCVAVKIDRHVESLVHLPKTHAMAYAGIINKCQSLHYHVGLVAQMRNPLSVVEIRNLKRVLEDVAAIEELIAELLEEPDE